VGWKIVGEGYMGEGEVNVQEVICGGREGFRLSGGRG